VHVVSRDQARSLTPCPGGQTCLQADESPAGEKQRSFLLLCIPKDTMLP
jgi:hypothetical protein